MTDFLIGTAFAVLLTLAITTVVLGVITSLKVHQDHDDPDS
ncbi:hypothetical protein [Kitasatospora sp. NPDC093806]